MAELRGGPLERGDKIHIHTRIDHLTGHYEDVDEIVIVEYLIPDLGKIIVKRQNIKNGIKTLCLYYSSENFEWDRL